MSVEFTLLQKFMSCSLLDRASSSLDITSQPVLLLWHLHVVRRAELDQRRLKQVFELNSSSAREMPAHMVGLVLIFEPF